MVGKREQKTDTNRKELIVVSEGGNVWGVVFVKLFP
jgi:hypothetical protein